MNDLIEANPGCCKACGQKLPAAKGGKSAPVWNAYSAAYLKRYGTEPVRNAKVSSQLSQLVDRLGAELAPQVAAFYVTHNHRYYVESGHTVGPLLKDAEKLCTEFRTGRKVTSVQARQADKTDANLNSHDEAMAMLASRRSRT